MAKLKTVYMCSECGAQHPKWAGQCSGCQNWNCLVEDVIDKSKPAAAQRVSSTQVRKISDVDHKVIQRFASGINEFDRVLGGGIVPGSVILLGGEPGIGKSTLSLQVLAKLKLPILYVAGEESVEQISLRAKRLELKLDNVDFIESTAVESIAATAEQTNPSLIVVDSIQVVKSLENFGVPGGISQIRAVTDALVTLAKTKNIAMILIGHVTKDGELAGPKLLEHLVDAVLYLEGDRVHSYRFLKTIKNRFGSTEDVGVFSMDSNGMQEIPDPAAEFIEEREKLVIGSALSCTTEGNRAFIVEIQALTAPSSFGHPKRSSNGFPINRLHMIIAVLSKYYGVDLTGQDVFVNVTGGFRVTDTACDLAVMKALVSSCKKQNLKHDTVYIGEVSLTGDVRKVPYQKMRESEVKRLGFGLVGKF